MNASQLQFRLPTAPGFLPGEIIVDLFAGAGGASRGIERAMHRSPDIAVNHDALALECHQVNHPATRHLREDVWRVRPAKVVRGQKVGLLWASPDCRHFSRAKGGKPVSRRVRSLANVVVKWAKETRPRVIALENVQEFQTWGPLGPDGRPNKARAGEYFRAWVRSLERLGYEVQHRMLVAADFGAPTSRKRFFLVARRDGEPIRWPQPTHGPDRPLPWRAAAECIDWSIPCPSIFERRKPLAEATLRRIARGVVRYVLQDPRPFIVNLTHGARTEDLAEPLRTVTGAHRGEKALVAASMARISQTGGNGKYANSCREPVTTVTTKSEHLLVGATLAHLGNGERRGQAPRAMDPRKPLGTVVAGGMKHAVCAAFLAKHYGGVVGQPAGKALGTVTAKDHHSLVAAVLSKRQGLKGKESRARRPDSPLPTVTSRDQNEVAAVHLTKFYGTNKAGASIGEPAPTMTATGQHVGLVAAFLAKYYGTAIGQKPGDPLHAITSKARFGVVTVMVDGEEYALADIGMRMLQPHELAAAQGFDPDYQLLGTKSDKVRLIGNSVPPQLSEAVVRANLVPAAARQEAA